MVSKIEIALITLTLVQLSTAIVNYQSRILNQRITHFENAYVDFNVRYFGDEGYPYMILKKPVTPYNDLHLMLYARVYDQQPHLLANAPISVCQLLHDESVYGNLTIKQFNIPQIFNLAGRSCPIEETTIRMSPYVFPGNFTTDTDIGCGYMNVEARLMKCDDGINTDGKDHKCITLLKTVTLAFFLNDNCPLEYAIGADGGGIPSSSSPPSGATPGGGPAGPIGAGPSSTGATGSGPSPGQTNEGTVKVKNVSEEL